MQGAPVFHVSFAQFKLHCPTLFETFFHSINALLRDITPMINDGQVAEIEMSLRNNNYVRFAPEGQSVAALLNAVDGLEACALLGNGSCWYLRIWKRKNSEKVELIE